MHTKTNKAKTKNRITHQLTLVKLELLVAKSNVNTLPLVLVRFCLAAKSARSHWLSLVGSSSTINEKRAREAAVVTLIMWVRRSHVLTGAVTSAVDVLGPTET